MNLIAMCELLRQCGTIRNRFHEATAENLSREARAKLDSCIDEVGALESRIHDLWGQISKDDSGRADAQTVTHGR